MSQASSRNRTAPGSAQLIGFRLGGEQFAIDITRVSEIIKPLPVTPLPDMPHNFLGMIQLRDQVVVVANLHSRFNMAPAEPGKDTRVIILRGHDRHVGIVVDAVSDVMRFSPAMIAPSPSFHSGITVDCILGIGKYGGQVFTILDVDALFPDAFEEPELPASNIPAVAATSQPDVVETAGKNREQIEKLEKKAAEGMGLYQELGALARFINRSYQSMDTAMGQPQDGSKVSTIAEDIPTASAHLRKVTEDTESATMKVMNYTEETTSSLGELKSCIDHLESSFPASGIDRATVSDIVDRIRHELTNIEQNQCDTMIALSFQDLTGQRIKKVINLMMEVEARILQLVVQFGVAEADEAIDAAKQKFEALRDPQEENAIHQGKVDEMLAEFGF